MNKFKLGQKVKIIRTGKIGRINNITSEDFGTSGVSNACYRIEYIKENDWNWFTVHDLEEVKEILDAEEKEYLSNVIKPFRNRVIGISKAKRTVYPRFEFIEIQLKKMYKKKGYSTLEYIRLPFFKRNKMYKEMELGKQYTLEELGL